MDKIASLLDLEKLKDGIASVDAATQSYINARYIKTYKITGPIAAVLAPGDFSLGLLAAKTITKSLIGPDQLNSVGARENIPAEIEISPELFRFLAEDEAVHAAKAKIVKNLDKRWTKDALLAGSTATAAFFLFHDPMTLGGAAWSGYNRYTHGQDIQKEYARIMAERDAIARAVLGHYSVTEPEPGKYVLKRGEWQVNPKPAESFFDGNFPVKVLATIGSPYMAHIYFKDGASKDVLEIAPVGVDPKIDLSVLPNLPAIEKGRRPGS